MTKEKKYNYHLTIAWLYPDLMSTYGDRGNVVTLRRRCEWRDISVEIKRLSTESSENDLRSCDLVFMGGGEDLQQKIVSEDMRKGKAHALKTMIEDDVPGLYICGAYQFLGKYYQEADGTTLECLNILDLYTENPGTNVPRLIGNVASTVNHPEIGLTTTLIGFENHGGRTYLGEKVQPLGNVLKGYGNNGKDGYEGALYKNSLGSYFHGPLLPKNPMLADFLIRKALEKKYQKHIELSSLDDTVEINARQAIARRLDINV